MNKTIYRVFFFIQLLSAFATIKAQEKAMLIEQIEGKTIISESFDRKDKLTGKLIFTVGNINQIDEALIIDIKTELFDEALNLEATYTTSYECRPEDADVLLSVFALNPKKKKIKVSANSGDFKKLYALTSHNMIHSISVSVYLE